jgi:hypothetical protein
VRFGTPLSPISNPASAAKPPSVTVALESKAFAFSSYLQRGDEKEQGLIIFDILFHRHGRNMSQISE